MKLSKEELRFLLAGIRSSMRSNVYKSQKTLTKFYVLESKLKAEIKEDSPNKVITKHNT